ncbi:MAG TPA: CAP domain-containing protein [Acidimicrobiia bacterium]|jgi:uncharacterized protein YkwD
MRLGRRIGSSVAALAIAGTLAACGPGTVAGPAPAGGGGCAGGPPDGTAAAIFDATNASRASAGLPALQWDAQLSCLASEWSKVQGDSGSMYHRDLGAVLASSDYVSYQTIGENVLQGPADMSGSAMHSAWMNSPEHRANILSGAFSSFAVAVYYANGQVWATENFGG